ncbi:MAG: DUF1667 domain-containing protein [Candidatus Atribacteria bacterium]|nr:DUF1667 domain-containing protein [Candidatus Atribacteria bacterium]MCD6350099.1 DUF1667 domain-containing protein [Candidatus Atribacteria bacterium]
MEKKSGDYHKLICIVCPRGCSLEVVKKADGSWQVRGACPRGKEYAITEVSCPRRVVTTTVKLKNSKLRRLPVKTSRPFPKEKVPALMEFLKSIEVEAPVKAGEVVVSNLLGEDIDLLATRSVSSRESI